MGRIAVAVLVVGAGCYSPTVAPGSPCETDQECPSELRCVAGHCGGTELPIDAPMIDTPADSMVVVDAPPDAPPAVWSMPTLIPGVNSNAADEDPSITSNHLMIVFMSTRNGTEDLFMGIRATPTGTFTVQPIGAVNSTTAADHSPEISADGTTLYFASDRVTAGNFDIYTATFDGNAWSSATLVIPLTSSSNDHDIAISPDGLTAVVAKGSSLVRATRASVTASWSTPVSIGSTIFGTSPAAPSLTGTGDLYLHATVAANRDLFISRRSAQGTYATAVPIAELNTAGRDASPFISADETSLLFERDGQLYQSTHP